jgi:23S rRNA (cytidine1920-2'-O)/16S rRNA (cytidine1409-2'-O)-methyltransferase
VTGPSKKCRADLLLVERGLFESRARAQAAIAAGLVLANGSRVRKPSDSLSRDANLEAQPAFPWVSRGGVKLAGALERYPIEIEGHICLDVGASTGGFTEVLLSEGAALVFAVDVGTAQLDASLRGHANIVSMENTDIRKLAGTRLPARPDIVVIDVSFISLKAVLPAALELAAAPMHLLALIKPQFEAPRSAIKKGIVRDEAVHRAVCDEIAAFAATLGCDRHRGIPVVTARRRRQSGILPRRASWLSSFASIMSAIAATASAARMAKPSMYPSPCPASASRWKPSPVIRIGVICCA